jgi:GrpB-like predicted nucleotidyltransferase (UPF0157 family)
VEILVPDEPLRGPVVLASYSPDWPARFDDQAQLIHSALGDRATLVEHVGSTSVPGLAAKPVIDICLAVADPADEHAYVRDLTGAGYVLRAREPEWFEHRLLRREEPRVNLHVFGVGCPEVERMLRFRDRLRDDSSDRARYEATKRDLAARHWETMQDYADAKIEVVEEILHRA